VIFFETERTNSRRGRKTWRPGDCETSVIAADRNFLEGNFLRAGEGMKKPHRKKFLRRFGKARWLLCSVLLCLGAAHGQQPAGAGATSRPLPDSPQPKQGQQADTNESGGPEKFVGYLTKRSLFFPDIAASGRPIGTWQKFQLFGNEAVSPEEFVTSAISAGFSQARGVPYADGGGWEGYGKRFGASMARGASNNFFGTFVLASALHQDPRYFPHSHPTIWTAMRYASRRLVITRSDSGEDVANISGLLGPLMGESLANVYLPVSEQTAGKTFTRFGSDMAWRFAGNMFKEYWPTFFRNLGLQRLKVVPQPVPLPPAPEPSDHSQH
jgi:hypothetical protein